MKHIFLFIAVFILFNCKPEKEEPKPLTGPVLTTMEAGDITAISALSGGAISSDGGSPVTARGIVWSISHNPTLSDSVSEEGTGIGSFTSDLKPLKYSTTYYVRAYATNSIGTTYGNEVTFNTKAAVPSDGLVGWWPFNGNANDESGNGNDGVVNGALSVFDRFKVDGSAYYFNGNSSIEVNSVNTQQELTLSVWVKAEAPAGVNNVWNYSAALIDHTAELLNDNGYSFLYNNILGQGLYASTSYSGYSNSVISSTTDLPLEQWVYCVFTFKDGLGKLYVNGGVVASQDSLHFIMDNNNSVIFGRSRWAADANLYQGYLDDIAIYNRALTAEEIQKIYNGTGF